MVLAIKVERVLVRPSAFSPFTADDAGVRSGFWISGAILEFAFGCRLIFKGVMNERSRVIAQTLARLLPRLIARGEFAGFAFNEVGFLKKQLSVGPNVTCAR